MKYALVNPNWTFDGSIYFGCREPHLPLEYGYAGKLLEKAGHEALLVDGQLRRLSRGEIVFAVERFRPDFTVVTTAPSYLFWRCAPPELRVPQQTVLDLREIGGTMVAIGPHGSTTPRAAWRKLGVDAVLLGEAEELLAQLTGDWSAIPAICYRSGGELRVQGSPHASDMKALEALEWPEESVALHAHHHHRFEAAPEGPGAEIEVSRGCPYHCSFCAKENFRTNYRKRPHGAILEELDRLLGQGVKYVYFIDEIFLPDRPLLEAMVDRRFHFGVQTRIDLWRPDMLELLGRAGCVSIEAGVESITEEGRDLLDKNSRLSTQELADRLITAKRHVPFVQANLLDSKTDDPAEVEAWRRRLIEAGVWANQPVPLFPYPGAPDYTKLWGAPDDRAWERAHEYYLKTNSGFSDLQDARPLPLEQLELGVLRRE